MHINNIEKYAFEKSDWQLVEILGCGSEIFMGRPSRPDAEKSDPCWFIKRVIIDDPLSPDKIIETKYSDENVRWSDRFRLTYKYI